MRHFLGIVLIGLAGLIAGCVASEDSLDAPDTPAMELPEVSTPEVFSEADQTACTEAGGLYQQAGMLGWYNCFAQYTDGGKVCSDASDCQGDCRSSEASNMAPDGTPEPMTGQCTATSNPFGCYTVVSEGQGMGTLCVD